MKIKNYPICSLALTFSGDLLLFAMEVFLMENKMFAMLIHLCDHMWADYYSTRWIGVSQKEKDESFQSLKIDWDLFKDYIEYLQGTGLNTLLIDVGDAVKFDRHPDLNIRDALTKDECKKLLD